MMQWIEFMSLFPHPWQNFDYSNEMGVLFYLQWRQNILHVWQALKFDTFLNVYYVFSDADF